MTLRIVKPWEVSGELHVELVKPIARFGMALQVYKRTPDGKVWHAIPDEGGTLVMQEVEPHSYPDRPTLYLDDDLLVSRLRDALNGISPRETGEFNHLMDAIGMRNRLMDWMETIIKRGDA